MLQGEVTPLIGSEILLGLIRSTPFHLYLPLLFPPWSSLKAPTCALVVIERTLIRPDQENPHNPSHPPVHSTSHRITFRPIQLSLNSDSQAVTDYETQTHQSAPSTVPLNPPVSGSTTSLGSNARVGAADEDMGTGEEVCAGTPLRTGETAETETRSMFLQRPAKNGPNRPEVFPGKQRDIIRAEKRAEKALQQAGSGQPVTANQTPEPNGDREADEDEGMGMEVDERLGFAGRAVEDRVETTKEEMGGMEIDPVLLELDSANTDPVEPVNTDMSDQQAPTVAYPPPNHSPIATTSIRRDQSDEIMPIQAPTSNYPPIPPTPNQPIRQLQSPSIFQLRPQVHRPQKKTTGTETETENIDIFTSSSTSTPGAGPSTPMPTSDPSDFIGVPSLDTPLDTDSDLFATGPRASGRRTASGRPRTRPLLEIHRADQLAATNINFLPNNVRSKSNYLPLKTVRPSSRPSSQKAMADSSRVLVSPLALGLALIQNTESGIAPPAPPSLEFTKGAFKRWIAGTTPGSGSGSRGGKAKSTSTATATATATATPTPKVRTTSGPDMDTPGAGPSTAADTGTPTPRVLTREPKSRKPVQRSDVPFLKTVDHPPPSRARAKATTTVIVPSPLTPEALPTQTQAQAGQGNGDPPAGLEAEARKDVEDISNAEALEALRDAIEQSARSGI